MATTKYQTDLAAKVADFQKVYAPWASQYSNLKAQEANLAGANLTSAGQSALAEIRDQLSNLEASKPKPPPGSMLASSGSLTYFNPSIYGIGSLNPALSAVRKEETSGNKIMKTPKASYDITKLQEGLSNMSVLDLAKLGDFGEVLKGYSGSGSTGQAYVPTSVLSQMAKDYAEYGLGDLNQAVLSGNAWDVAQPQLSKIMKIPQEKVLTAQQMADKKANAALLENWNAQKAKWTSDVYNPYQSNLATYNKQFTGQYTPSSQLRFSFANGDPVGPVKIPGSDLYGDWGILPGAKGAEGAWYVNRGDKGYELLNPYKLGGVTQASVDYQPWPYKGSPPKIVQLYQPATFYANPGEAPVFNVAKPEAYVEPEHTYAPQLGTPGAIGGTSTSALGQLLRKTHGQSLSGVQNAAAQQALTQQLYGSGGLSAMGRMLSQGTNESLGGISNPMLRGMLSSQLFD